MRLALEASKRRFNKVYYCENSSKLNEIKEICDNRGISTDQCSRYMLNQLVKNTADIQTPHKGVCADVTPLVPKNGDDLTDDDIISDEDRLWLLLCSIGDPVNLGAIIRSAYFLGVDRIFTCSPYDSSQASAPLSPVASRSSSVALEIFTPKVIRQPETFLERLGVAGNLSKSKTYRITPQIVRPRE